MDEVWLQKQKCIQKVLRFVGMAVFLVIIICLLTKNLLGYELALALTLSALLVGAGLWFWHKIIDWQISQVKVKQFWQNFEQAPAGTRLVFIDDSGLGGIDLAEHASADARCKIEYQSSISVILVKTKI